jgi:hypothetical protein
MIHNAIAEHMKQTFVGDFLGDAFFAAFAISSDDVYLYENERRNQLQIAIENDSQY